MAQGKVFNTSDGGIVVSKLQVNHVLALLLVTFPPTGSQETLTKYVASCLPVGPDYPIFTNLFFIKRTLNHSFKNHASMLKVGD